MNKRDFLSIATLGAQDVSYIFTRAKAFKKGVVDKSLDGKSIVLIFEKPSTRTRISFEVGIFNLGGHPIILTPEASQLGRGEPIKDTARILSGYCDGIVMRTFAHSRIEEMASSASIPVVNALTDLVHPCQVLSDCFTLNTRFGPLNHKKIAWIGDGNNMANSWINAASLLGFELWIACPKSYTPDKDILDAALKRGAAIRLVKDPRHAAKDAIAINTDVWASMGKEGEKAARRHAFQDFQVDSSLMALASPDAVFMHCLPAHRGQEVTEDVLDGPRSIVWEQAQNRLYVQNAIMEFLIKKKEG